MPEISPLPTDEGCRWNAYKALYLHIPFCAKRCDYCDFSTQAVPEGSAVIDDYIDALVMAIRAASKQDLLGQLDTVYIGGGTPTFCGNRNLSKLLYALSMFMHLTPEVECTLEANPDSLTDAMVKDLFALGVTRLSLGVQSFDNELLSQLGRIHDAATARAAIKCAQQRFENISIDLMCALPEQTVASFEHDVRTAIDLGVKHVSIYPLQLEEGTPLYERAELGRIVVPADDMQEEMMCAAEALLTQAGMRRYEVASYAYPGFESRHNKAYWSGVPYMGLGTGAFGMRQNDSTRERYCDGEVVERLDARRYRLEDLMLSLRTSDGASDALLSECAQENPGLESTFEDLVSRGLLVHEGDRFKPTHSGWLLGNELFSAVFDYD